MPVVYDNALTRAHSQLQDALPPHWTVDQLDLKQERWDNFELTVSFPYGSRGHVETILDLPLQLLYDVPRMAEIVMFEAEMWVAEANDNNAYVNRNWKTYLCPDKETVFERVKPLVGDHKAAAFSLRFLANQIGGKRLSILDAGYYVATSIYHCKDVYKLTGEDRAAQQALDRRRDEIYRALFPDEPIFAEHCIADWELIQQRQKYTGQA